MLKPHRQTTESSTNKHKQLSKRVTDSKSPPAGSSRRKRSVIAFGRGVESVQASQIGTNATTNDKHRMERLRRRSSARVERVQAQTRTQITSNQLVLDVSNEQHLSYIPLTSQADLLQYSTKRLHKRKKVCADRVGFVCFTHQMSSVKLTELCWVM